VLFAARRHGGTAHSADHRPDRRALAAACDAADDRSEPGAAADLPRGFLALALTLAFDVRGRHFIDHSSERDGVQLERDFVAAFHLTGLGDLHGLERR
jgi:hypothetical protein